MSIEHTLHEYYICLILCIEQYGKLAHGNITLTNLVLFDMIVTIINIVITIL